jgi:hypothetical protein
MDAQGDLCGSKFLGDPHLLFMPQLVLFSVPMVFISLLYLEACRESTASSFRRGEEIFFTLRWLSVECLFSCLIFHHHSVLRLLFCDHASCALVFFWDQQANHVSSTLQIVPNFQCTC